MGTIASELGPHAERLAGQPRVYVDANVSTGLVAFMRTRLQRDVLFVIEHDDLRRARDGEQFRLAREWRRTLIRRDREYLDDRRFPPSDSGGVLVLEAPEEKGYLTRLASELFRLERSGRPERSDASDRPLPFEGRKLHVHVDWQRDETILA